MYCEKGKAWTSLMLRDDGTYTHYCSGCRDTHDVKYPVPEKEEKNGTPDLQSILLEDKPTRRMDIISRFGTMTIGTIPLVTASVPPHVL